MLKIQPDNHPFTEIGHLAWLNAYIKKNKYKPQKHATRFLLNNNHICIIHQHKTFFALHKALKKNIVTGF